MCRTVLSVLFLTVINVTLNYALTYVTVGRYWEIYGFSIDSSAQR